MSNSLGEENGETDEESLRREASDALPTRILQPARLKTSKVDLDSAMALRSALDKIVAAISSHADVVGDVGSLEFIMLSIVTTAPSVICG